MSRGRLSIDGPETLQDFAGEALFSSSPARVPGFIAFGARLFPPARLTEA